MEYEHIPVMLDEVIEYLDPKPGENFIDCTLGGGGYAFAIAEKVGPRGRVLAIDLDEQAIKNARTTIEKNRIKNIILVHDDFKNLRRIFNRYYKDKDQAVPDGVVFDLGLSSAQLNDRDRGFSFLSDAPLDMRFAHTRNLTNKKRIVANNDTEAIVNKWRQDEIERILREYGEERYANRIAAEIVKERKKKPVKTTGQLVEIIRQAVPTGYTRGRIHFATRTFQALRIATNDELNNLARALPQAVDILPPEGRLVAVSYHSLEDRIVKHFFKKESRGCICPPDFPECRCRHQARLKILTKRVVLPEQEEIKLNPRARSAKLRAALKL